MTSVEKISHRFNTCVVRTQKSEAALHLLGLHSSFDVRNTVLHTQQTQLSLSITDPASYFVKLGIVKVESKKVSDSELPLFLPCKLTHFLDYLNS